VISRFTIPFPESTVIVNGGAPLLNTRLLTSTEVVLMEIFVISDIPKVATSPVPFGTVFGIQFAAVFQSPLEGFVFQVALPA
jgi:hypothetical protein